MKRIGNSADEFVSRPRGESSISTPPIPSVYGDLLERFLPNELGMMKIAKMAACNIDLLDFPTNVPFDLHQTVWTRTPAELQLSRFEFTVQNWPVMVRSPDVQVSLRVRQHNLTNLLRRRPEGKTLLERAETVDLPLGEYLPADVWSNDCCYSGFFRGHRLDSDAYRIELLAVSKSALNSIDRIERTVACSYWESLPPKLTECYWTSNEIIDLRVQADTEM